MISTVSATSPEQAVAITAEQAGTEITNAYTMKLEPGQQTRGLRNRSPRVRRVMTLSENPFMNLPRRRPETSQEIVVRANVWRSDLHASPPP